MEKANIDRLKRRIFLRTLAGLVAVGSVLVATVMVPLRSSLEEKNSREIEFTVNAKATAIDQFVSKIVTVAEQFASRTQIRKKLDDYNQGRVSQQELVEYSSPRLLDALRSAEDAVGITRLDHNGAFAVAVGKALPAGFLEHSGATHLEARRIYGPVTVDGEPLVIVATPIRERDGTLVGTDVVLFGTGALKAIVQNYAGMGTTGEAILMYPQGSGFLSFYPPRRSYDQAGYDKLLNDFVQGKPGSDAVHHHTCDGCVVTIRTIKGTDWLLLFRMSESELNAIVDATTRRLVLISALILIGGMAGIYLLTYPLLQSLASELAERTRMLGVLSTNELALRQTQNRLEEDIQQRKKAEEALLRLNEELEGRVEQRTRQVEESHAELMKAYDELKAAHSRLVQQEKLASIGQLAAGVAHELNNPLSFVLSNLGTLERYVTQLKGYLQQLESATESIGMAPAEQAEVIRADLARARKALDIDLVITDLADIVAESVDGGDRMKKIILDLKSFARVDSLDVRPANINEGLESTLNIVWNELKYKATVTRDYGELPPVLCNLGQLNQVFMNILVNAAQSIETTGEIRLTTRAQDGWVAVTIADTGCGIPAESLHRIFEPFFTTKEVGKGTGLGLSIAYDIVKKHGGDIAVESQVGKGTTFTVRLPVRTETDGGDAAASEH